MKCLPVQVMTGTTRLSLSDAEANTWRCDVCRGGSRNATLLLRAQVTSAFDGQEALDKIVAAGGPDAFDVILMDLHMPQKVCMHLDVEQQCSWPPYLLPCCCWGVVPVAPAQRGGQVESLAIGSMRTMFCAWTPCS